MIYQFGKFEIDTRNYQLRHDGTTVELEPKVFDLLNYLVANREKLVTRDELFENIWSGQIVSDTSLSNQIKAARKAIGDDGKNQSIIKTAHGRGYQFIAETSEIEIQDNSVQQGHRQVASQKHSDSRPSIAVLPFTNLNGDPEHEYISDGITEDILIGLCRFQNLLVISRCSVFLFKGKAVDPIVIAGKLGAEYLLEGSVRIAKDRVRITTQLVDGATGNDIWAETYDRVLDDVFSVQDDVTQNIVRALAIRLTPRDQQRLVHPMSNNIEAYDVFLRGQQHSSRRTREANEMAKAAFKRAIELDPGYARAYGALGVALMRDVRNAWTDLNPVEVRARARELVNKAVALNQTSPQVYWAQGYVYLLLGKYQEAADAARRSTEIAPNYADGHGLFSLIQNVLGHFEEAIEHIQIAMDLNPYYSYEYDGNLGRAYFALHRYDQAVTAFLEALEKNENAQDPRLFLAASYVRLGRLDDAAWEIDQIRVLRPDLTLSHLAGTVPIQAELLEGFLDDLRAAGLPE